MNIFVLSTDVAMCARFHCDKHVVKMATEYAQLLSTAARLMGYEHDGYASTHENHPCTKWAAERMEHWAWLYELAVQIGAEYTRRYNKRHAATDMLERLPAELVAAADGCRKRPKKWVQCVPDDCKQDNVMEAYRKCYRVHKADFATWRPPATEPAWFYHEPAA